MATKLDLPKSVLVAKARDGKAKRRVNRMLRVHPEMDAGVLEVEHSELTISQDHLSE